ncbi:ribokinase [Coraliomargarita sp. SDUM461004]|uniref:Ribokinase n=1 Tax=Thalassobacterium sedimentorum TaxID=3041258 RepID=A0ABU1AFA3_9BACT|nr:ribokinase [Coraliomargarita sp. SDUM461004]MDQ8193502.1 ribokinase [Coraliomargarita sp. SDUM461004]
MNTPSPVIAVVGSANMDLSIPVPRFPREGETILSGDVITNPGGKGANQAVSACRAMSAASRCIFIGKVGEDAFGAELRDSLAAENMDVSALLESSEGPTGMATIMVNDAGNNGIMVSLGANALLSPEDIEASRGLIESASVLVVQLEIPYETVAAALAIAHQAGVLTILDPAPAPQPLAAGQLAHLPDELWQVDIFSPNQTEAELLTGIAVTDLASARQAGACLLAHGPKQVILKLGGLGAAILTRGEANPDVIDCTHVPAMDISICDTTAAGDAFTGALAAFLTEGRPLTQAVRLAGISGSLACTRAGAQSSIPMRTQIFDSDADA